MLLRRLCVHFKKQEEYVAMSNQTQTFKLQHEHKLLNLDKKTNEKSKTRPRFVKQDQIAIMRLEAAGVICMEPFKTFPQMGRFTLRDEGQLTNI